MFSNFIPADAGIGGKTVLVSGWSAIMVGIANIPGFLTALHHLQGKLLNKRKPAQKDTIFSAGSFCRFHPRVMAHFTHPCVGYPFGALYCSAGADPNPFFFWIGSGKFSLGSKTRTWGAVVFNFSTLMPVVIFVEIIIFLFAAILLGLWFSTDQIYWNKLRA